MKSCSVTFVGSAMNFFCIIHDSKHIVRHYLKESLKEYHVIFWSSTLTCLCRWWHTWLWLQWQQLHSQQYLQSWDSLIYSGWRYATCMENSVTKLGRELQLQYWLVLAWWSCLVSLLSASSACMVATRVRTMQDGRVLGRLLSYLWLCGSVIWLIMKHK